MKVYVIEYSKEDGDDQVITWISEKAYTSKEKAAKAASDYLRFLRQEKPISRQEFRKIFWDPQFEASYDNRPQFVAEKYGWDINLVKMMTEVYLEDVHFNAPIVRELELEE